MKAITRERYGEADVVRLEEVDRPEPREGQVLVRVEAAGLDQGVWHLMAGSPRIVRAFAGFPAPRQRGLGGDLAGVVVAVGPRVSELAVGDRVFGRGTATFAEFAVASASALARIPDDVSSEQAAALPVSGCAALLAVRTAGVVRGDRALVLGAGGGVGSFALQLARLAGAHATAVASTRTLALVRSLGADAVVDYTAEPLSGST